MDKVNKNFIASGIEPQTCSVVASITPLHTQYDWGIYRSD